MNQSKQVALSMVFGLWLCAPLFFLGCDNDADESDDGSGFCITPSAVTLNTTAGDASVMLRVSGGAWPYRWTVESAGLGSISSNGIQVIYTAKSGTAGQNLVRVYDAVGNNTFATVSQIKASGTLAISPTTITIDAATPTNVVFTISGGISPYSWQVHDSRLGRIHASVNTAIYTSEPIAGANFVTVSDAGGSRVSATILQN